MLVEHKSNEVAGTSETSALNNSSASSVTKRLLSKRELAAVLNVSERTLDNWLAQKSQALELAAFLRKEIVALQERARLLQDEIAAKLASETNRHLFAVSVATVFLLPPTLVAGIFGMNVSDLPFTKETGGFLWAMALCVLSSVAAYGFLRWLRIMR